MRIMQIGHSHFDYVQHFHRRFKRLGTHEDLMRAYRDDYYWCCHSYIEPLERMGHETFLCLPTDRLSQSLWCKEHGLSLDASGVPALLAQIEWFKPDILYISSAAMYHDDLLHYLTWRPPFIVGWHATITQPHMHFQHYDLILSSHEECLRMAQEQGARHTAFAYPGIPLELAGKFTPRKITDICFSGYWAESHPRRNQFLYELARRMPSLPLNCAYYLGFYENGPPCPEEVQRLNRGALWGMSMFKAFASSRIVLNGYTSINSGPQNLSPNMRQMEALGVGSFLLTEQSDNLAAFFTEDVDLATYSTTEELVEKSVYYQNHEEEREAIAAQGLATCHRYYTMDIRACALLDAVNRVQQEKSAPTLEWLQRDLRRVCAAHAPDSVDSRVFLQEEARKTVGQALELSRQCLLTGQFDEGLSLFERVESLPVLGMKDVRLCQALRAAYQQDVPIAMTLLRQELEDYPENDAARHSLSQLVRGFCGNKAEKFANTYCLKL